MTEADRAAALAQLLRARKEIDGQGLYVPGGERESLLARLRSLGVEGARGRPVEGASAPANSGRAAPAKTLAPHADIARLAASGSTAEIEALDALETVRRVANGCTRCRLHESRRTVVFADGSPDARVMCVGEAPGRYEDESGVPFVGRAGKLLDQLLLSVGLPREDVYICNVLKCRPPQNRNPQEDEIERCSPFLRRQVALVRPEVVVAFGTFAVRTLLGLRESLGRMRGRTHVYEGVPLVATYHPAALLRNPNWIRPTWEDLQRVRQVLKEGARG